MKTITLEAQEATPEAFAPFGQVIKADDKIQLYGPHDAQLDLSQGTPRFYMLRARRGSLNFHRITYHEKVTQCLAAASDEEWYMAVAAPNVKPFPKPGDITAFRIPSKTIVKLDRGTWHAGPLFTSASSQEFYNLELSDTNETDHNTHDFKNDDLEFSIQDKTCA